MRDLFTGSVSPELVPSNSMPAALGLADRATQIGASSNPSPSQSTSATPANAQVDELLAGTHGAVLRQAAADRRTVLDLVGRLSDTERTMLPEVAGTAVGLYERIVALAGALQRIDDQALGDRLPALDERIARIESESGDLRDRERRLSLLKRQKDMLAELAQSRSTLLEQYESAGILLQNLALDVLKIRSSGLDSAMNGIASATQEARALSREIGYVLDAAKDLETL
jgi:serine/threonine-protein kinase